MIKKRDVRMLVVILSMLFLLLLSSCNQVPQGETATETSAALSALQSGTRGVEANFIANYPPTTLYDINDFIVLVEVENKGNYDLSSSECFVQVTGFDPNIIRGVDYVQSCGDINGRSVYNLDGGFDQVEWESSNIDLPTGSYEYKPTLNLVWCYDYTTFASPSVCVDPLFYEITSEQKSCTPTDVSGTGGQGGPVGVGYVGVDMIGDTAVFEISVKNYGTGRVLSENADISDCGGASIDYDDLDIVSYNVEMTGGSLIECSPSDRTVRLSNGAGKIICSFRINSATAFETPLQITLDYSYIDNTQKSIQIIKTP